MSLNENPSAVSEAAKERIPEWAKARAVEALNKARRDRGWPEYPNEPFHSFPEHLAIARLIVEHEEAPVDPVEEGLREAWKQALSVYHSTHIDKGSQDAACLNRLRNVLAQRGIELGRAST